MIVNADSLIKRIGGYKFITCDCNGAVWVWQNEPFRNRASGEWDLRKKQVDADGMGIEYDVVHEFGQEVENWDKLKIALTP